MSKKLVVAVSSDFCERNIKSMSSGTKDSERHFDITEASWKRITRMADNSGDKQVTETEYGFGFTFMHNGKK